VKSKSKRAKTATCCITTACSKASARILIEQLAIMTVSSLWTVLDEAGCGKAVGAKQMTEYNSKSSSRVNPWNYNEMNKAIVKDENRMTFAVDLSIWICEGLTSTAMTENHAEPALHLVFTRTMRLLNMGIKLVAVTEGKRRVRGNPGERDSFKKRRTGTAFWKACHACESMLRILGVPVVRAKAEGEALCALLNQRDIVDGVISNDGDCLLFGAKVVYTRFSLDNLDKSLVIRYDVSELRGCLQREAGDSVSTMSLERGDLVSFALLTGSDLAGDGLPKVGHKKAIRFIKQCKIDYPLTPSTAAIDELKSWARTASASNGQEPTIEKEKERCCSLCCHPGDKRSHEKHGCELCGTEPGEPCFASSTGDKFRNSLRAKALAMVSKFDPTFVMEAYMNPNDNQVPITLLGDTARSIQMEAPSLVDMVNFPHIIKGRNLTASKDYVKQSVAKLLAHTELVNHNMPSKVNGSRKNSLSRERPIPSQITRRLVHNKTYCYEISWSVNATITDDEGNGIDGYEFSTIEAQALVEQRHPNLVQSFLQREKEEARQGDAEVNRRRDFVVKLLQGGGPQAEDAGKLGKKKGRRDIKRRSGFFGKEQSKRPRKALSKYASVSNQPTGGEDVHKLMAVVNDSFKFKRDGQGLPFKSIDAETESTISELSDEIEEGMQIARESLFVEQMQDRHSIFETHLETDGDECLAGRRISKMQLQKTPTRYQEEPIPLVFQEYQTFKHEASFKRVEVTTCEACEQNKRKLAYSPTPSPRPSRRLRWSTPVTQMPLIPMAPQNWHMQSPWDLSRNQNVMSDTLLEKEYMPLLTPGNHHSMICDMGIQIEITPLVSSKYF
jgi:flap endonuclease GEN